MTDLPPLTLRSPDEIKADLRAAFAERRSLESVPATPWTERLLATNQARIRSLSIEWFKANGEMASGHHDGTRLKEGNRHSSPRVGDRSHRR